MEVEKEGKLLICGPQWWAEQQLKPRKAARKMVGPDTIQERRLGKGWGKHQYLILVKQAEV